MDNTASLDKQFADSLTKENVIKIFNALLFKKTDLLDGSTKIATGSDSIDYIAFEKNIDNHAKIICELGKKGNYIFAPFRERIVPKPPYEKDQLELAKKAGKTRTLSIETIQDTVFQQILIDALSPFSETKFDTIDAHSFAYRKNKSSKLAVRKIENYIEQGYLHILDGDIEKFFDKIDHLLLYNKLKIFFGKENELLLKYLYRFINVKSFPAECTKQDLKDKKNAQKRMIGIPQGGVLSGLLANIFLYDFDRFVINELMKSLDFKYIRYADDFVLMFKHSEPIDKVYSALHDFLQTQKLNLHPLGEKTKILDLTKSVNSKFDFLGFEISPCHLKVKKLNIMKFLHRIYKIIESCDATDKKKYLSDIPRLIRPKIVGLEDLLSVDGYCPICHKLLKKRNWIGYFMVINDVRLLRNMDTKIRKMIYNDYHHKTKNHLRKKDLLNIKDQLPLLERTYYKYKKQEKFMKQHKLTYCDCTRHYDSDEKKIVTTPAIQAPSE